MRRSSFSRARPPGGRLRSPPRSRRFSRDLTARAARSWLRVRASSPLPGGSGRSRGPAWGAEGTLRGADCRSVSGTRVSVAQCRALCSWLSREAPERADPPELAELHEILTGGSWVPQMVLSHPLLGRWIKRRSPVWTAAELEELVYRAANALSDEEIRHWLRHGRGRGEATSSRCCRRGRGAWSRHWPSLSEGPRLAGIGRLVSRLEGGDFAAPAPAGVVRTARWWLLGHRDQGGSGADLADPVRP